MAINSYSIDYIGGYWWLFMVILLLAIGGYSWLFYCWLLVVILLMAILLADIGDY